MTDPIADMLTRIKNALLAGHPKVIMPHSKLKKALADILLESGYISKVGITEMKPQSQIEIELKYVGKTPAITEVRRLSKPGRRLYASVKEIPRALGGYGITVVSTSKGIMTDQRARKQRIGGEIICQVW